MYPYRKFACLFYAIDSTTVKGESLHTSMWLSLNEATCHFSPWSFLHILHIITLCLRWKFIRKENSINVKDRKCSQVRWVRGEQPLLPLVSKETRFSFSALPVGYPGSHHCSLCPCTPLAEAPHQARACLGTRPGCCCYVALRSGAAWHPLAHWHASYSVDPNSIGSKSFTAWRGQAAGPEAF